MTKKEILDNRLAFKLLSSMITEINSESELKEKEALAKTAGENGLIPSNMESGFINETFQALNDRHNVIYEFVMRYNDYIYAEHDYGNGHHLTMVESHTLTFIEDHPGTTVTELASHWHKTKGAISQIVSRLENLELVTKIKKDGNGKNVHLYVTKEGYQVSRTHKLYDILDITKTLSKVQKECTPAEIDTFYKVISVYYKVICKDFEEEKIPKRQGKGKNQAEK